MRLLNKLDTLVIHGKLPITYWVLTTLVTINSCSDLPSVSGFISQLADILDRVVTFSDPMFVVGDVNIYLERDDDRVTCPFIDALNARGLVHHVTPPTHDCGGTLDIVVTRSDLPAPSIDVISVE